MSTCTVRTGMLFWKKPCGAAMAGNCRQCGQYVCDRHGARMGDNTLVCSDCAERSDDDSTGTVFTTSSGLGLGAAAGAAAAASSAAQPEGNASWHGSDGGDAGGGFDSGGDSGGGDSGGSSGD